MSDHPQFDLPPELHRRMLDDFYAECDEHLKNIRQSLVLLEPSIGKAQADLTIVEELFRNFHSFKGISAIVGLRAAETLAHACEDFLRELRRGRASLATEELELLMEATQKLEQVVVAFRMEREIPGVESLLASLKRASGQAGATPPAPTQPAPRETSLSSEGSQFDEAKSRGLMLWRCTFIPTRALDEKGININVIRARLAAVGEILQANPQVRGQGQVAFVFMVGMRETPSDITQWEADGMTVELLDQTSAALPAPVPSPAPDFETTEPAHNPFIAPSHVVRVDLQKLDELMRITGEMVIHRSRFEEQLSQAKRKSLSLDERSLNEVNTALSRSLRELREAIMQVRLVPVAEIFARMPFVVRDLARETKKQVRLTLEGQQTELDKYLIERLKDPLLHLVRNAFSHGIETAEERLARGKPAEGTIVLTASTQGGSVLLQIRDDGRGIDANAVAKRARAQGLNAPEQLDNSGLLKILCAPGFSTREDADRAAGRGVGMAVVAETVRELGGDMTLETALGRGTTFTLSLPLTLAIAETFIVSAGDQTCAIPQNLVREVMLIQTDQIRTVNRVEIIPYRSGVLPITRLSSLFHLPPSVKPQLSLLVLTSERGSSGLVVDRIHGQKEVVVRSMRDPLVASPSVMGATELGDGRPVLILDAAALTSGPVKPPEAKTSPVASAAGEWSGN